jgi:hypothetical protein
MSRRRSRRLIVPAFVATVIACGALGVGVAEAVAGSGHSGTSSGTGHSAGGYGALPGFLPTSSLHPDATLVGSADRPALTTEGDPVRARFRHGSVLMTVSGPVVPGEGLPYQATATTATWTVTMSDAVGRVPVSTVAFSTIDLLGQRYQPQLVPGQRRPPTLVRPGHTVRFELRTVMPVGEGTIRWAPARHRVIATWDFVVEND